jgi:hypothetical protein
MPFGKYKGTPMKDVPASYLDWLHGQDWLVSWPQVLDYIEENRDVIDLDLELEEMDRD